jgi:hypothetical protein
MTEPNSSEQRNTADPDTGGADQSTPGTFEPHSGKGPHIVPASGKGPHVSLAPESGKGPHVSTMSLTEQPDSGKGPHTAL